ncbi:MAG: MBL fold metallo-hydrolase [Paludibacteraceae bacterium]|nr:MBL fold metallo-hydrolase [Paludibacteraceae bacterium]
MNLIFRSLGSGSSGNCYYVGTKYSGVLIDAGISARLIQKLLKEMDLDLRNIMAVFVTHDHADHIRSVGTLGEKFRIPIYTTQAIHDGIDRNYGVREKLKNYRRFFEKETEWDFNGMIVNTFTVSHDSTDCIGYVIDYCGQRFMLATDCGQPSERMEQFMRTANHIVIEANHDEHMLLNGPYPTYLKDRILSPIGHQSNETCAALLQRNYHPGLHNVFLCHLSQENNDPNVAFATVTDALDEIGVDINNDIFVKSLARTEPSQVFILDDKPIEK